MSYQSIRVMILKNIISVEREYIVDRTASGQVLNADVNGALNILRKSSVVDVNILYSRGEVDTPIRIRIA